MINKLKALVLVGCLALAPAAFAIPFSITVSTGSATASGNWALNGPTSTVGSFNLGWFGSTTQNRDIAAGLYSWSIGGSGSAFFSSASWVLRVNGSTVDSGSGGFLGSFRILDSGGFEATAVPEPGTLALLGLGLLGIGFSVRRRQTEG